MLLLSLGDHVLSATADRYQEVRVPLHVDGGEDLVLRVELAADVSEAAALAAPPSPTPPPAPTASATTTPMPLALPPVHEQPQPAAAGAGLATAAWITLGGAALLGGASAVSWIVGSNRYAQLERSCGGSCSEAQLSPVKRADLVTNVFLGASLLAAGAAALLFVIDMSAPHERAQHALQGSPQGLALRGSF
jgi:hypothetical protein